MNKHYNLTDEMHIVLKFVGHIGERNLTVMILIFC